MELEDALKRIKELEGNVTDLTGKHDEAIKALKSTHEKELQINYNKGFDKAKNASEDKIEKSFISKDEVQKMLADAKADSNIEIELTKAGVKNVAKAVKLIDNKDEFDLTKFKEENDFLFDDKKDNKEEDKKSNDPKPPANVTKNNENHKETMTAESYAQMSDEERGKVSTADKLALL